MDRARRNEVLTWIAGSALGMFFLLRMKSAAWVDGIYTPVGNDSFYHARRILDAAVGERGFYQFDNMIHVPEGSWLTWPWAYDYLMAKLVGFMLLFAPASEPMTLLAHLPLLFWAVTVALLVLIAREIRLHPGLTLVTVLAFAVFPRNQFTFGVGVLDHHSVEQVFCLLSVWLGLRFFRAPADGGKALALGAALGVAPAFHNGLFILQLPMLVSIFVLWLRGNAPPQSSLMRLAGALIGCTLLVLLPSGPFLDFQFSYSTLSWFHLYAAFCAAVALIVLGRVGYSPRMLAVVVVLAAVLLAPLLSMIINAKNFLTGDLTLLSEIAEVQSPLGLMKDSLGIFITSSNYTWLILAAPVIAALFAWQALREDEPQVLYLAISAVFGLLLLLTQVRLHVFGSWALFLGGAWWIERLGRRRAVKLSMIAGVTGFVVALAYYPAIRYQLFKVYPPGLTNDYSTTRGLYPTLANACRAEPGTALAQSDDGHHVRYHSDCSVIANNFLLTRQHGEKILELQALLEMTPEQLLEAAPHVDYVFARLYNVMRPGERGYEPTPKDIVIAGNDPLIVALNMRNDLPQNFRLLAEIQLGDRFDYAYARVFKVVH